MASWLPLMVFSGRSALQISRSKVYIIFSLSLRRSCFHSHIICTSIQYAQPWRVSTHVFRRNVIFIKNKIVFFYSLFQKSGVRVAKKKVNEKQQQRRMPWEARSATWCNLGFGDRSCRLSDDDWKRLHITDSARSTGEFATHTRTLEQQVSSTSDCKKK